MFYYYIFYYYKLFIMTTEETNIRAIIKAINEKNYPVITFMLKNINYNYDKSTILKHLVDSINDENLINDYINILYKNEKIDNIDSLLTAIKLSKFTTAKKLLNIFDHENLHYDDSYLQLIDSIKKYIQFDKKINIQLKEYEACKIFIIELIEYTSLIDPYTNKCIGEEAMYLINNKDEQKKNEDDMMIINKILVKMTQQKIDKQKKMNYMTTEKFSYRIYLLYAIYSLTCVVFSPISHVYVILLFAVIMSVLLKHYYVEIHEMLANMILITLITFDVFSTFSRFGNMYKNNTHSLYFAIPLFTCSIVSFSLLYLFHVKEETKKIMTL